VLSLGKKEEAMGYFRRALDAGEKKESPDKRELERIRQRIEELKGNSK